MRISHEKFDDLVFSQWKNLMRKLPDDIRAAAQAIVITIQSHPFPDLHDDYDDTLGLFEGVPLSESCSSCVLTMNDTITLFRIPLAESCKNESELKYEIRITLIHELGHYLGFSEEDLEKRGLG